MHLAYFNNRYIREQRRGLMSPGEKSLESEKVRFSSVQFSRSVVSDPMNHSTPGLPVHHQLPEFTQTHGHRVRDDIQPSHPLASPFPPAPIPPSISPSF